MTICRHPESTPPTGELLERFRAHLLDREYMSGIERDKARVKANAEVFTPDFMVEKMLDRMGDEILNPRKKVLDPACGDGQFLAHILHRRLEAGHRLQGAISTLYGIDIMKDNVEMCRERLMCGLKHARIRKTVERNIVRADARTYHMLFDGSPSDIELDEDDDLLDLMAQAADDDVNNDLARLRAM